MTITDRMEAALREHPRYVLRLYIVGGTDASRRALSNLGRICDHELAGSVALEVIDVARHPVLAAEEQIVAAPTLVKQLPLPVARIVGDLSDTHRVLLGLDIRPVDDTTR